MNEGVEKVSAIEKCLSVRSKGAFHLSKRVDYALFLLSVLMQSSKDGTPISLKTIANSHKMSFYFLQNIARVLRKKGIIEAERGKKGGFSLRKDPAKIVLRDIVEALEGPINIMYCLDHTDGEIRCNREEYCKLKGGFKKLNEELNQMFLSKPLTYFII